MISHKCPQSQTRNGDETPSYRRSSMSRRQETLYGMVEEELKMRFHTVYTVFSYT